ncbi:MAG: energy-coupling factor transporter ATPase [Bacillota bacterium]|jgi:energy-coupling factor transport system ATP-binding protein|nr:energy-coupling factor transporter ATPase [Candidatus Fermentithermobacillaceae bacterium]
MPIEVANLTHTYMKGTTSEVTAISGISFRIDDGEFVGLIGATGSGKSTLIQHLNGLLKPTSGKVMVDGVDIWSKGVSLKEVRRKIGLVFQYPEQQVFEETVYDDIAFGPRNLGYSQTEVESQVKKACALVGLAPDLLSRSPFELSGGQARRVAIAGILAIQPKVLILDEPTAGLDPRGRTEILDNIKALHRNGMTVILVSHNMDDVARLCERVMVLDRGKLVADGPAREVFSRREFLESMRLKPPEVTILMEKLRKRGWAVRNDVLTVEEAYAEIVEELRRKGVAGAV